MGAKEQEGGSKKSGVRANSNVQIRNAGTRPGRLMPQRCINNKLGIQGRALVRRKHRLKVKGSMARKRRHHCMGIKQGMILVRCCRSTMVIQARSMWTKKAKRRPRRKAHAESNVQYRGEASLLRCGMKLTARSIKGGRVGWKPD